MTGNPGVALADFVRHGWFGTVNVDSRTGAVDLDGERLSCPPSDSVALSRLYYL